MGLRNRNRQVSGPSHRADASTSRPRLTDADETGEDLRELIVESGNPTALRYQSMADNYAVGAAYEAEELGRIEEQHARNTPMSESYDRAAQEAREHYRQADEALAGFKAPYITAGMANLLERTRSRHAYNGWQAVAVGIEAAAGFLTAQSLGLGFTTPLEVGKTLGIAFGIACALFKGAERIGEHFGDRRRYHTLKAADAAVPMLVQDPPARSDRGYFSVLVMLMAVIIGAAVAARMVFSQLQAHAGGIAVDPVLALGAGMLVVMGVTVGLVVSYQESRDCRVADQVEALRASLEARHSEWRTADERAADAAGRQQELAARHASRRRELGQIATARRFDAEAAAALSGPMSEQLRLPCLEVRAVEFGAAEGSNDGVPPSRLHTSRPLDVRLTGAAEVSASPSSNGSTAHTRH